MSTVTTGLNTAARIHITSSAPTLVLVGASQLLTYQITAQVTDVDGNVLGSQPELYYNIVAGNDVADVSDTGLVTATGAGQAVVQVSCAPFGQNLSASQFTPAGVPMNAITAEQNVQVIPGVPMVPDFSISLSSGTIDIAGTGTASLTITQTALHGFTGTTSYYVAYPPELLVALHLSEISWSQSAGYVTGSGSFTVTFTTNNLAAGSYVFFIWGLASPQAVNSGDLYGDGVRALTHTVPVTLVVS